MYKIFAKFGFGTYSIVVFDGMVKERSLSCDSAAAWKIRVIL